MRTSRSLTGPLVLIVIGIVFLIHSIAPSYRIGEVLSQYWPYLLIGWGVLQLIEVCLRFSLNKPFPVNGLSGGAWLLVVLVSIAGLLSFEARRFDLRRPDNWWRHAGLMRGIEAFGQEHEFSVTPVQKSVGKSPRLIIENFRGDAKITGTQGDELTLAGHKVVRAFDDGEADRTNTQTPVDVVTNGNTIIIRCNQDKASPRTQISTNLDISVPRDASLEVTGILGDFDVSALTGSVDISSENAGVRLQDIGGAVKVDTRRSDLIRCNNIKGSVDVRGHGRDVELTKIAGQVTIGGSFLGDIALRELAKPVRVENVRTEFAVQQVPGEIRLDRGSVSMQNIVGPTRLTTRATDVTLENFTDRLEVNVDKGDVELSPGRVPLGQMIVNTRSGNIELAVPQAANFAINATTDKGEIANDFGDGLRQYSDGRGAKLDGSVGTGPDLRLSTKRGRIIVRKSSTSPSTVAASSPSSTLAAAAQ
jgi:DUF4097 and DUF4098 domain-containing protein YvlB